MQMIAGRRGSVALDALRQAFADMQQLLQIADALQKQQPADWRRTFVGTRREMQAVLQRVITSAEQCFDAGVGEDLRSPFREASNKWRTVLALHQANWPVVSIDPSNPDYQQSLQGLLIVRVEFEGLVRQLCERSPVPS